MKKYLVALLCLCMTISALSANMPLVNAETNAPSAVTVEANQAVTAPSFSELISEGTWGTKAVHIDKDSQNAELYDYNGVAEEVAADMYFQWDEENLYVGMVTSDADLRGSGDYWTGDGIQIRVGKGVERTSFVDVCVTLDAENNPSTAGWNQTDEAGNTLPICEHNLLLNEDGTEIHIMMAIPLERLGLSAEAGEIGDGTELNVSLLRISGTQDGPYAGWLAWGAFFAPNHDYHKSLSECNVIVLKEAMAENGRVVTANKAVAAPSFSELISEGTWGTKAVHIDKDSQNAELYDYNGVAEEVAADMYFQWDEENLYVGMVTSDADLRGDEASYKGDGIQIRVGKGAERTSFVDFYVTLDAENKPSTAGWNQTDEAGNTLPLPEHNMLLNADGTEIHMMVAIPLDRLGLSAEAGEIGDGTELNVSLLRISGTKDGSYAGWLAWGAFFAPNHDYHKSLSECNIIVLKDDVVTNGRVVIAEKTDAAPSFTELISEDNWGAKAVHINKDSYNAELYNYNGQAEEVAADMYFRWDEENLYVGMVTSDADLRGSGDYWTGDGIQIRVGKGVERTSFVDVCVTLDEENKPSTAGWNQSDEDGNTLPICEHNLLLSEDGTELHIMMAIPLERLGLSAEAGEIGDGTELNVSLLRISGTQDGPYAGWLAWGAFFAPNHDYHKSLSECNIIVFHDPNAKAEDDGESFTSALTDISESSKIPSVARGMNDGYKIVQTETATYAVYADWYPVVNGSNFDGGLVNDFTLQKIVNGTSTEVGQGLSWNSDIDVVADADGNVYVVGGSSSWAIGRLSNVYDYTATPEKAILQIHAYDDTVGFMQGYSISKNFTEKSTDNYKYLTTTIDQTNNKIYTAYVGPVAEGAIIEIFEFDIATMTWSDNTIVSTLPGLPEKATAFVDEGVNIICNANDSIYKVNAQGTEEIGQGTLVDAYNDTTGNLHVMYQTEGAQTLSYMVENETAVETSIPASGLTRMFEANGKVMAVSTVADVAATVKLYEIGETVTEGNTVVLDKVVRFRDVLMVTRKDNGSVASDDLTLLFPGNRISISSWYHAVLPLNTATE